MRHAILGTAGHIDHGKTTLVKALTGIDTDRLPEEKARGITIDLGFAFIELDGMRAGIVDVPGHEGLIRNMLAGATGIDAMLLVVAADEGIMPQTREHLAIAQLLDVQRIVIALTKADLVDTEWLALVREEVSALVEGAPVVAVSAVTGSGLDELRRVLAQLLTDASGKNAADLFRMPIDRVFSVRGTGTVVTGTVWSGRAGRQDVARVLPGARTVRIRGVESHGSTAEHAGAGERAAFVLVGIDRSELQRGQVLVTSDVWAATTTLTAHVEMLSGQELKQRQRVRLHLGTAEVMARVHLLDHDWIQLRLEQPVVARARDHFVLRSYSPVRTIGGGVVAELARTRKRLAAQERAGLERLLAADQRKGISAAIGLAADDGCKVASLPVIAGVSPGAVDEFCRNLPRDVVRAGDSLYPAGVITLAVQRLRERVAAYHEQHPLSAGIEKAALLAPVHAALADHVLSAAVEQGIVTARGSIVALAGFSIELSTRHTLLREQLLSILRRSGLAPPTVAELRLELQSPDVADVLHLLEVRGEVTGVSVDLFVETGVLADAVNSVRRLANGPMTASEFRAALPVSRKYLIPLLEYLDRAGITRREGDLRWVDARELPESA